MKRISLLVAFAMLLTQTLTAWGQSVRCTHQTALLTASAPAPASHCHTQADVAQDSHCAHTGDCTHAASCSHCQFCGAALVEASAAMPPAHPLHTRPAFAPTAGPLSPAAPPLLRPPALA